jgi:hypothetical protein
VQLIMLRITNIISEHGHIISKLRNATLFFCIQLFNMFPYCLDYILIQLNEFVLFQFLYVFID